MSFTARTPRRVAKRALCVLPLLVASLLTIVLSPSTRSYAQTNIDIGKTVKQSGVKRFGINLANQDFYDSGMMVRNLIFRNPGFEGETWTTILVCHTVTSTSCQDSNPYSSWPANFMQNATYTYMSGPAAGQTGKVTSQDPASYTGNYGVTLHYQAPSVQPNAGDYLQVRTTIPGNAAAGWFILNQSGATLSTDTNPADQAPGTTGTQCLQVNGSNPGQSVQVSQLFDTNGTHSFIQLNGSFTITFKAKSIGGSNQFNVQVVRQTSPVQTYLNQNVNLTSSWATYSYTFNAAETGSAYGALGVYFNFNGNSVLLDDVQMSPDKNAYGTPFRDEVVSTLLTLKPGVLRYMDSASGMGTSFDNIIKDQFGRQRAGWSLGASEIDTVPVGLYDFLKLCQAVGAEPWWAMPTATNQTEMAHIMEYMAGSTATTYGAIRAAQGQSAPWTNVFPVIHLELGNEVWNGGSFSGETIVTPDGFGKWANTIFGAGKASSYYAGNSSRFDFVIGSLEVNDFWTQYELDNCAACDTLAVASYMLGTFADYSSLEAVFGPLMAYPQWLDGPSSPNHDNRMYNQVQVASGNGVADAYGTKNPAAVAIYETNLGTNSGTAPQAVINSVVPSVGAGVATANHMLMMLRDLGVKTQSMFALSEYTNPFSANGGSNATTTPLWGTVIDIGGASNLRRPQFLAEQLANGAILPTMLTTKQTGDNPTWNQPLSANDNVQLNNVQYLQSYAFTDGTHQSVVVMNLHRTASLPVKFTGANAPQGDVIIQQLTSANITDTNETSSTVKTTTSNVTGVNGGTAFSLPPFSMTVFLWPGTALPNSTTTLTATPQTAAPGQSVSMTAIVTSQGASTPTGSVTFSDGGNTLGSSIVDGSGTANFASSSLSIGAHSLKAFYSGDGATGGSTSSSVTITVSPVVTPTSTTLSVSPTTANPGTNITLTAVVVAQSGNGTPTGTVTFTDGTSTLGTRSLDSGGTATLDATSLSVGSHSIVASYGGSGNETGSTSNTATVTISSGGVNSGNVPNGVYTLTNQATMTLLDDPSGSTAPGVQIIQWPNDGSANEKWALVANSSGFYTIQNATSGLYLASPDQTTNPGIPLEQDNASNDDWQLWQFIPSGGGYTIRNKASGLAMDYGWVEGIDLWTSNGGTNQSWALKPTTSSVNSQIIPNGNYKIINKFTGTLLDDNGGSAVPGLQIIQWPASGGTNQSWRFTFQGAGYYTIQNLASSEYLTSPNSSTSPGIPLVQDPASNNPSDPSQLWQIIPYNGYYVLRNEFSGLVIDYPWSTGIDLWSPIGAPNQLWSLTQ